VAGWACACGCASASVVDRAAWASGAVSGSRWATLWAALFVLAARPRRLSSDFLAADRLASAVARGHGRRYLLRVTRRSSRGRSATRSTAGLLLACVLAAVAVFGARPRTHLAEWVSSGTQIGEASREGSAPADKVDAACQADLGYVHFPIGLIPAEGPRLTGLLLCRDVAGGCRPGYTPRIDRPPRLAA
jgi:hypothetical protein